MKCLLRVPSYKSQVKIGCTEEERQSPQTVSFSVEIKFDEMPLGCNSDSLDDTICYAEVCKALEKVATAKSFCLVEHLAAESYSALLPLLKKGAKLRLGVTKEKPPIAGIESGVEFVLKD